MGGTPVGRESPFVGVGLRVAEPYGFYVFRVGCEGCASALSFALTDSEQKAQESMHSGHQGEESQTKYIKKPDP